MEIEQLKLILDTVAAAGEGAFWIAIFWIAKGYFVPLLTVFTLLIIAWIAYRVIQRCTAMWSGMDMLAKRMGYTSDYLSTGQYRHIAQIIINKLDKQEK